MTNAWAALVVPLDPGDSPWPSLHTVAYGNSGPKTLGVDILMESRSLGIGTTNPLSNLTPLTNDDFGTRQFLCPSAVPESRLFFVVVAGIFAVQYAARTLRQMVRQVLGALAWMRGMAD